VIALVCTVVLIVTYIVMVVQYMMRLYMLYHTVFSNLRDRRNL